MRTIKVSATAGAKTASTDISVSGTKLAITAFSSINLKTTTDMVVKLVDSSGNALVGKPVTFSAQINPLTVKGGGASPALTDNNGQLVLSYTAQSGTSDTITVKAQGDSLVMPVAINAANFTINAVTGANVALTTLATQTCYAISVHSDVAGTPQTGNVRSALPAEQFTRMPAAPRRCWRHWRSLAVMPSPMCRLSALAGRR